MLDGHKLEIRNLEIVNRVWNNPNLSYKSEHNFVNRKTGEIRKIHCKQYKNLTFTKHSDKLEISGSFHKFFNDGLHNANDFTVSDCIKTIENLCLILELDATKCYMINLEFGININPVWNVTDIVKWARFHNRNQFIKYPNLKECFFAGTSYFGIKLYNKTLNYPEFAAPNTMRFECKSQESKYLRSKGIVTLADLMKPSTYDKLSNLLMKEWNSILIFDKRTKKGTSFCNTDFWLDLKENFHRNTWLNKKKCYFKLLGKKGLQNLIYNDISAKLKTLNNCALSTIIEVKNNGTKISHTSQKLINSVVQFPPIVYVESSENHTAELLKLCNVTHLDISMQKDTSKYLCNTGLRWYHENEPDTFQRLKEKYLIEEKENLDEQIYYIAHNIRNKETNKKRDRLAFEIKNYHPQQLQLF